MIGDLRDHIQSSLGGSYVLDRELGSGGMSRVFVADDLGLGRKIVVKVLHPDLAEGLSAERFKREIKVAAQLQHPHIVPLLASGELPEGLLFYTMPFIEGESLRQRLTRDGGLPIAAAVATLRDVASALGYAHRQRVVHRDIKPENILLSDGGALVTDFGIAKALSAARAADSPTDGSQPSTITRRGTSLGTPAYMAPEQAAGDAVDHRADLYALGVVGYELLTGRPPFEGRTAQQLLAAHAATCPEDVIRRRPAVPPHIGALVMQLLEKRPADRPQTADEVVRRLDETAAQPQRPRTTLLPWAISTAAVGAAAVLGVLLARQPHLTNTSVVAAIAAPPGQELAGAHHAAFSLDGRRLAFVASDRQGRTSIWVRAVDSSIAMRVDRTDGAMWPFWSPDGHSLGFFADRQLRVIDTRGGSPRALCPTTYPSGGAWTRDDIIVYSPVLFGPLYRVAASGGPCTRLTTLRQGEFDHRRPSALPDGRVMFSSFRENVVLVADAITGTFAELRRPGRDAQFVPPNWLVFRDEPDGPLYAQRFDLRSLRMLGEPRIIAAHIATRPDAWARFTASTAALLYNEPTPLGTARLVIVDRRSVIVDSIPVPGDAFSFDLSHDGRRIAFGGSGVWIYDRIRRVTTRLATQTMPNQGTIDPTWSPGDSLLVYRTAYAGTPTLRIYRLASDGSDSVYAAGRRAPMHLSWAPDGRTIGFTLRSDEIGRYEDVWMYSLDEHRVWRLFEPRGNHQWMSWSPDGRWLTYQSDETGAPEIFVRAASGRGAAVRLSTAGGECPRWRPDGRALFYRAPDGAIMEIAVRPNENGIEPSTPKVAVVGAPFETANRSFAVLGDGKQFLAFARGDPSFYSLVLAWQERVR